MEKDKAKNNNKNVGNKDKIYSDVLGSYTGKTEDKDEKPVQDADDL